MDDDFPEDMLDDDEDLDMLDDDLDMLTGDPALDIVQNTMETFFSAARVEAVYGEPVENGDHLIIPTAEILSAMGFGAGTGFGTGPEDEDGSTGSGGGSGGGGGGRVLSRPVAVVIAYPEGVRVEPVIDLTKIALAALTAGGFMAAMVMGILNPRKALRSMRGS